MKPFEERPGAKLGALLRQTRQIQGSSLRRAAESARISPAYLSQLEAGAVRDPSPRVLYELAQLYASPERVTSDELYGALMKGAGYVVPGESVGDSGPGSSPWEMALRAAAPITSDEEKVLSEYLAWFRSRNGRSAEGET